MKPVNRGIVIIGQSLSHRRGGEGLLFFAHTRGNDGSSIVLELYEAYSPIIDTVRRQQVTSLVSLLDVFRHAVDKTVVFS